MNIIVTGASRGIGFETVKTLAGDKKNQVFAIARGKDKLEHLKEICKQEYGFNNVHAFAFDLYSGDFEKALVPAILEKMKKVDVLINNAGLLISKPFEQLNEDDFDRIYGINVKSVFKIVKYLLPYFSIDSHIVNISSMGGYQGSAKFPGLSLYSSSKGALAVLSECMAEEFKERQIKVNSLALGSAQTEMLQEAFPGYKAPLTAHQMAKFVSDFAIHGHQYFNGKILPVSVSVP
jgi:NAD(P)-dependent dehydrogenase (short-subunit alcohol dehydrogenase family)